MAGKAGAQVRAYGMSATVADFNGDGLPRPLHDRHATHSGTSSTSTPRCRSASPAGCSCRSRSAGWRRWRPATRSSSRSRTTRSRTRPRARAPRTPAGTGAPIAADLDNDSWPDIYATNGMWGDGRDHDRELEFWWQSLAYWDDYVAGTKTFDRKGAGIAGIERDRFFRNRSGDREPLPRRRPLRRTLLPRRPRPGDQRPRRRRLRRQQRRRPRPLHPLRPGPRGPLPRHPPRRTSTTSASSSAAPPAATTATASAPESRRLSPAAATS